MKSGQVALKKDHSTARDPKCIGTRNLTTCRAMAHAWYDLPVSLPVVESTLLVPVSGQAAVSGMAGRAARVTRGNLMRSIICGMQLGLGTDLPDVER